MNTGLGNQAFVNISSFVSLSSFEQFRDVFRPNIII